MQVSARAFGPACTRARRYQTAQAQAAQDLAQQRQALAGEKALVEAEKKAIREELLEAQRQHQSELKVRPQLGRV